MHRAAFAGLGLIVAFAFAACGGGSGGGGTVPPPPTPTPTPSRPVVNAAVAFAIAIPSRAGSARVRRPRYVSPATQIVQIAVNGGTPQTFPVGGGQTCTNPPPPPGSGSCAVYSVQAPVGTDTFVITLMDGSNHVLSAGTVQQTIVADQTNTVNVVFDGVVASLRLTVSNPAPPSGSAAFFAVTPQVFDAAGFTIVGAPGALPAITIADSDSSGATGLYLAGSDGTCKTQAAAPASSVTTTVAPLFGVSFYTNVCLSYGGQALAGGATLTASIANGPTANATFSPAGQSLASGAWMFGTDSNNNFGLVHFDANMIPLAEITGSSAQLTTVVGLALDAAGNVYTSTGNRINVYAPGSNGNVGPTSGTDYALPSAVVTFQNVTSGLALDGAGNAFSAYFSTGLKQRCFILQIPLTGSSTTASVAADCNPYLAGRGSVTQLATDGRGFLYAGYSSVTASQSYIVRYAIGAGGALTVDAELTTVDPFFTVDSHGNVYAGGNGTALREYPAGTFVHGQRTSVPGAGSDSFQTGYPVGIDAAGNLFAARPSSSTGAIVIPAGSHTASSPANFAPAFISGALSASGGSSGLSAQPRSVETQSSTTITVSESGYSGAFQEVDDCGAIATVTPASANGPSATFTVTAKGGVGGTCHATFGDSQSRTASVAVGVTAVNITGTSRRRKP